MLEICLRQAGKTLVATHSLGDPFLSVTILGISELIVIEMGILFLLCVFYREVFLCFLVKWMNT